MGAYRSDELERSGTDVITQVAKKRTGIGFYDWHSVCGKQKKVWQRAGDQSTDMRSF
jgi:hypothetical protein